MFEPSTAYLTLKKSYAKNLPEYLAIRNKSYPEFVFEKARGLKMKFLCLHSIPLNHTV
jgi:hypothetical protein